MKIILDLETDGLLPWTVKPGGGSQVLSKIHCLSWVDADSDEAPELIVGQEAVAEWLRQPWTRGATFIAHNGFSYDFPVLKRLLNWTPEKALDTKILAALAWPDIRSNDEKMQAIFKRRGEPYLSAQQFGKHKLVSWGIRLGVLKGTFSEGETDWSEYTDEMGQYCQQDVRVTRELYRRILKRGLPEAAVEQEHRFAEIIARQEERGFSFDRKAAERLQAKLEIQRAELTDSLRSLFPPRVVPAESDEEAFAAYQQDAKRVGLWTPKGLKTKEKVYEFNPGSGIQVAWNFAEKYGWKPTEWTPKGAPKMDEPVLRSIFEETKAPEAEALLSYATTQKLLGYLSEGKQAWLAWVHEDGKLHGAVNTIGTISTRCSHYNPNLGQVPAGKDYRSLFVPSPGHTLVGCDMSGLELRCLAHYLWQFDDGEYAATVVDGDIHTLNQEAAGLDTRAQAKTFIYALIYGAGDAKIGSIVGGAEEEGAAMKKRFFRRLPALAEFIKAVRKAAKRAGAVTALNGLQIPIRSDHSAPNLVLQSAGAILTKRGTVLLHEALEAEGLQGRVHQVAHVHDEVQLECEDGLEDRVGQLAVEAFRAAGELYGFKPRLDAEYKVGRSWADTH